MLRRPPGWRWLYGASLLVECVSSLFRFILVFLIAWFFVASSGAAILAAVNVHISATALALGIGMAVALSPQVMSVSYFFQPYTDAGSFIRRWEIGAYEPSAEIVKRAKDVSARVQQTPFVQALPEPFYGPWYLFVVPDKAMPKAETIGETIYVSEALLASQFFPVAYVHQLAYLNNGCSQLFQAVRILEIPGMSGLGRLSGRAGQNLAVFRGSDLARDFSLGCGCLGVLLRFGTGGLSKVLWGSYWREAAYAADEFVYCCGLAPELIRYLEFYTSLEIPSPYFTAERPYIAERVERLRLLQKFGSQELKYVTLPQAVATS